MTMTILPAFILSVLSCLNIAAGYIYGAICNLDVSQFNKATLSTLIGMYSTMWIIGFITTLTEWKSIHTSAFKKLFYTFTFPFFMFTYIPISFVALFKRVKWTPIAHTKSISLDEIKKER